jgi:SAM-dependent methyltransferase
MNSPEAWSEQAAIEAPWTAARWSQEGQERRFEAVLRHLDLADGDTLLDFGAGTGYFSEFLPPAVTYYAYDWAPGMRERVRSTYERAWVLDEMPDMEFDHVVCIGTFNLAENWSKRQTWATLESLWVWNVRKSLTVSLYRGDDPACLRYEPDELLWFAGRDRFIIDNSFAANDILLAMRR